MWGKILPLPYDLLEVIELPLPFLAAHFSQIGDRIRGAGDEVIYVKAGLKKNVLVLLQKVLQVVSDWIVLCPERLSRLLGQ